MSRLILVIDDEASIRQSLTGALKDEGYRVVAAGSPPVLTATALSLVSGLAGFCAAGTFLTQAFTWPLYVLIGLTAAMSQTTRHLVPKLATPVRSATGPTSAPARLATLRPTMRGMLPAR